MPADVRSILDRELSFDPASDGDAFDAFVRQAPAKWVVYLFADASGLPVQLLCVKNLRYSLKRRLGVGDADALPSKRVNYRELVRTVHYRRVDSAFEADWIYYEAARLAFPATYRGMVGFRPAWFVHVDPDAKFPRFTKTIDLSTPAGRLIGPVEDKHAAGRLVQLAEDAFDLCRYYNILVEAPDGKACAYKEMGKCPAPCDGSISMPQYRRMVEWAADTAVNSAPAVEEHSRRMRQAAAALQFETAGRIKQHADGLAEFGKGAFRHAGLLRDFAFVSLQRGPSHGDVKVFLITPGRIDCPICLTDVPEKPADMLRHLLAEAASHAASTVDPAGAERVGIVAHHLFSPKSAHGAFLPIATIDERAFAKAYKDVLKQKAVVEDVEDEGVMKELQAI